MQPQLSEGGGHKNSAELRAGAKWLACQSPTLPGDTGGLFSQRIEPWTPDTTGCMRVERSKKLITESSQANFILNRGTWHPLAPALAGRVPNQVSGLHCTIVSSRDTHRPAAAPQTLVLKPEPQSLLQLLQLFRCFCREQRDKQVCQHVL